MSRLAFAFALAFALATTGIIACASASSSSPSPADPPVSLTNAEPEREGAGAGAGAIESPDHGSPGPATDDAALDPQLLALLTAHREDAKDTENTTGDPSSDEAPARCHPERPDTPAERSLCICERVCATTIDRQAIARRRLDAGGDPEAVQRWLDERTPGSLHYPYAEVDGLRIDFAGDGTIRRCRHSVLRIPESDQTLECETPTSPRR